MKTTRFFVAALLLMASFFVVGCGQKSLDHISNDDWVDLGLPSGLLWASRNVGATKPEDYGYYFAWGETQTKSTYTWENYKYYWENYKYYRRDDTDDLESGYTKYCSKSSYGYYGYHDNLVTLQSSDDAAAANVSGSRMPTRAEWEELDDNCTWKWITLNGVPGMCVTGRNGKSLFLPAAGRRWGDETYRVGSIGYYWSSSLDEDYPVDAWYLDFRSDDHGMGSCDDYRGYGFSVRPVR